MAVVWGILPVQKWVISPINNSRISTMFGVSLGQRDSIILTIYGSNTIIYNYAVSFHQVE
jgi:hypothetical protein